MKQRATMLSLLMAFALSGVGADRGRTEPAQYFEIQVIDGQSGRGVPLVELETVNHLRLLSDSAGRIAFYEPGLMNQRVFFQVHSDGYAFPKDGFGYAGMRLETKPSGSGIVRLKRLNVAERLYRVTGEGIYRDTVLLGKPAPLSEPLGAGLVAGQDSVQGVVYRNMFYWFWGDTLRMSYPLGQFHTSGATSELPAHGGLDPQIGINLHYFTNADGFSREMCPLERKEGPVWIDGLMTLRDETGRERLLARYSRWKKLGEMLEQGIVAFNDDRAVFERVREIALGETWRKLQGHPVRHTEAGLEYYYFGDGLLNVRTKADWKSIIDPNSYEAWTCIVSGDPKDSKSVKLARDSNGELHYSWSRAFPPVDQMVERELVKEGTMKKSEARYQPVDVESGKPVKLHFGSIRWNAYRQRWIAIAVQKEGKSSYLGEVWYGEAREPTGPWQRARKIVTHNKYSFYNPVQHDFFDQEGGRLIYFEGTYSETFSGNEHPTPRYDYNQIMYQLDLADPRLREVGL